MPDKYTYEEWLAKTSIINKALDLIQSWYGVNRTEAQRTLAQMLADRGIRISKKTGDRTVRGWLEKWYIPEARKRRARKPSDEVIDVILSDIIERKSYKIGKVWYKEITEFPADSSTAEEACNFCVENIDPNSSFYYALVAVYPKDAPSSVLSPRNIGKNINNYSIYRGTTNYYANEEENIPDFDTQLFNLLYDPTALDEETRHISPPVTTETGEFWLVVYMVNVYNV